MFFNFVLHKVLSVCGSQKHGSEQLRAGLCKAQLSAFHGSSLGLCLHAPVEHCWVSPFCLDPLRAFSGDLLNRELLPVFFFICTWGFSLLIISWCWYWTSTWKSFRNWILYTLVLANSPSWIICWIYGHTFQSVIPASNENITQLLCLAGPAFQCPPN